MRDHARSETWDSNDTTRRCSPNSVDGSPRPRARSHRFTLKLTDWQQHVRVWRVDDGRTARYPPRMTHRCSTSSPDAIGLRKSGSRSGIPRLVRRLPTTKHANDEFYRAHLLPWGNPASTLLIDGWNLLRQQRQRSTVQQNVHSVSLSAAQPSAKA